MARACLEALYGRYGLAGPPFVLCSSSICLLVDIVVTISLLFYLNKVFDDVNRGKGILRILSSMENYVPLTWIGAISLNRKQLVILSDHPF